MGKSIATEHAAPAERRGAGGRHRAAAGVPHRAQRAAAHLARGLHRPSQAQAKQLERRRTALGPEGGIDWAPRRGAGVRLAADRGRADPAHRAGHRAGHLQPAPSGAARRRDRRRPGTPIQRLPGALAPDGAAQQPALGAGHPRVRVRLQRRGARGAGALGGAVRRLHQRRPGHRRPVHLGRALEVGPDHPADPAAAARLRGPGPGAFERPAGAVPPARGRGQHPGGQLHHAGAVLPPAAPAGAARPGSGRS